MRKAVSAAESLPTRLRSELAFQVHRVDGGRALVELLLNRLLEHRGPDSHSRQLLLPLM